MNKAKVNAMIRKKSEESGVSINTLLLLYFFETFLEGMAESKYKTNLIIKGGFLLSSMLGIETRTTMDMDMALANRTLDENTAKEIFDEIALVASKDEINFEVQSISEIKIEDKYPGFRVSILGRLENIRQPFSVDIATGDPITPEAIEYRYKSVFDSSREIKVLSYNLETIIAEKLETAVSRKTDNSRSKDFYDLYIVFSLMMDSVDVDLLREATEKTFGYRRTEFSVEGIITDLENIREDAGFKRRWDTYCKRNEYVDDVDFDDVIKKIEDSVLEIYE